MSLQSTFWHKGQRDTVGSRAIQTGLWALGNTTASKLDATAIQYYTIASTNGKVYARAAIDELVVATSGSGLAAMHENNPVKTVTDDGSTLTRTVRQNIEALVVASGSFCKCVITLDTAGLIRGYAGEIVTTNLASAKFPELDLDDECPVAAIEVTGAFTFGATSFTNTGTPTAIYALVGMP